MAYTASWDENSPAGSEAANTADNAIRLLKRDLRERMETLLNTAGGGTAFSADPIARVDTGKTLRLHCCKGQRLSGDTAATSDAVHPQSVGGTLVWALPLLLPTSVSLTAVAFQVYRSASGASVSCELDYIDSSGTKSTLSGPVTASTTAGWQTVSLSTNLPHTVLNTRAYYLRVTLVASGAANNDARLGSVLLTYSTTDSLAQAL